MYMGTKTVLITGASRGIGKAIALAYAEKKYNVIITCQKSSESLQMIKEQIIRKEVSCMAYVGDMGNPADVKALFSRVEQTYGGVDILINNAGTAYIGLLTDMTDEEWQHIMNTNLSSVFYCCRSALPYMIRCKRGKIMNISSIWGVTGASCEAAYSAAKAGVNGLTRALSKELAPSNIQVNALALGVVNTDMNACLTEEETQMLKEEIPAGRFAQPEEIAETVLKMTEGNDYMTGQIIGIDGGLI